MRHAGTAFRSSLTTGRSLFVSLRGNVKLRSDDRSFPSVTPRRTCSASWVHLRQTPATKSDWRDSGGNRAWASSAGADANRIVVPFRVVKTSRAYFELRVLGGSAAPHVHVGR